MQIKSLAILALSAGALATQEKRQADVASILDVLKTAVPTSLAAAFATNSAVVYSEIKSELAVGSTPSWIAALPTSVKSYLVGLAGNTAEASSVIANATSAAAAAASTGNGTAIAGNGTAIASNGTAIAGNGTTVAGNGTAVGGNSTSGGLGSLNSSGSASGSSTGSGSSSTTSGRSSSSSGSSSSSRSGSAGAGSTGTSSGMASLPTAIGMGLAGAVGLVGVLVL